MTRRSLLLVVGACAWALWHVASLTRSPVPYFDDTFFASIGESFARTGELRLAVAPLWIPDPVYLYGPVYFVLQRLVFALAGCGIFQNRVLGLVGGGATIVLAFALVRAAGGRRGVALATCLLLALDPTLHLSMHGGRMDAVALACVLASLLLLVRSWAPEREPSFLGGVGAGAIAALAVLTTPRSAYLVVTIGGILSLRWGLVRTRACALQLLGWGLGLVAPYALWIAYAFGGVPAFLAYYRRFAGDYVGGAVFVRMIHYPLAAALAAAAGLRLASGRPWRCDPLAIFAVAGIVAFYALGIAPARYGVAYAVFMTPLAYLALAALAPDGAPSAARNGRAARVIVVALLLFNGAVFAARTTLEIVQWRSRDPGPVAQLMRTYVPPGSKVIGDDRFYFAVVQAGADFQYWQRGGTLDARVAYHADQYGFDYLVTGEDRASELFRAYERRTPLREVAAVPDPESGALARWLTAVAQALHMEAPLVAGYGGTLFVRADRARGDR